MKSDVFQEGKHAFPFYPMIRVYMSDWFLKFANEFMFQVVKNILAMASKQKRTNRRKRDQRKLTDKLRAIHAYYTAYEHQQQTSQFDHLKYKTWLKLDKSSKIILGIEEN